MLKAKEEALKRLKQLAQGTTAQEIIESLEDSNLEKDREISKLESSISKLETEKKILRNSIVDQTDDDNGRVCDF